MLEKEVEKEFRKYKSKLIRKLGNHALDTDEINNECRALFGKKFQGTYAQDQKFPLKPGYYVINTDTKNGPGEHWIGLILTNKSAYLYDSFCRDPKVIVPHLVKRLSKYTIKYDKHDAEQRMTYKGRMVVNCGHSCISFLMIAHNFGIRASMKV